MDFDSFERRMLLRRIAHLDAEISETKREIARHGATEIDLEIIRLQEETRKNYTKCLAAMMERPQNPLSEMVEARGSGEPLIGQTQPRSLPPASAKKMP
jgi:hypothetical protein